MSTSTCSRCGRTYESGNGYSSYCSRRCYEEDHKKTCKICGKEFTPDGSAFSYKSDGYCSETCYRKARIQYEKPRAEKALEKWEKEQKKCQTRIDKLAEAIRSNDPEAMLAARKGSLLKRAGGCLVRCLKLIGLLIIFGIGYLVRVNEESQMSRMSRANNAAGESAGAAVESVVNTNANSTAIDMQKQKREEQLLERRRELLQPAREDGNTSAPVAEQE